MDLLLLVAGLLLAAWLLLSLDFLVVQRESVPVALVAGLLTLLAFPLGVLVGSRLWKK